MVEIEIGVLKGQCLDRRIDAATGSLPRSTSGSLSETKAALEINWMFSTDKARTKMARAYPDPSLKKS